MKQWGDYERPPGEPQWRSWQPARYDPDAHLERLGYFQQPAAPTWEPASAPSRSGRGPLPEVPRPGQEPGLAPGGKSWVARHKGFAAVAVAGSVTCVACVALAAESSKPAAGATAATAAAAPTGCAAQVQDWVDSGAVKRIGSFGGDLGSFAAAANAFAADLGDGGASADDVSGIRSTAAAIQSDVRGVQANPGPACVPGLRANLAAAAGDYSKAAADADHGMSQYTAGDTNDAGSQLGAAGLAIGNGNAKLALATVAVSRYRATRG